MSTSTEPVTGGPVTEEEVVIETEIEITEEPEPEVVEEEILENATDKAIADDEETPADIENVEVDVVVTELNAAEDAAEEGEDKNEEEAETEEVPPDVKELEKAVANLSSAKLMHEKATKEKLENANEYCKEIGVDDALLNAAREAQMLNSKKWYQFWQTATRIPKDNKYDTYTTNEKRTWKTIAKANEEFMREVVSEAGVDGITWKGVSNKKGVKVTYSPEKSEVFKTKMYKVEATLNFSPRLLLLTLVRGPVMGLADGSLTYFREHYNFVGGRTSLVHTIREISSNDRISPRDYFDLTNWTEDEDGHIIYTASSVKAFPAKMPGVVRGATLLQGFSFRPTENGGTDVTFVSQVDPKGWVWNSVLSWIVPGRLADQVSSMGEAALQVQSEGNEEKYIKKFVLRELDVE